MRNGTCRRPIRFSSQSMWRHRASRLLKMFATPVAFDRCCSSSGTQPRAGSYRAASRGKWLRRHRRCSARGGQASRPSGRGKYWLRPSCGSYPPPSLGALRNQTSARLHMCQTHCAPMPFGGAQASRGSEGIWAARNPALFLHSERSSCCKLATNSPSKDPARDYFADIVLSHSDPHILYRDVHRARAAFKIEPVKQYIQTLH